MVTDEITPLSARAALSPESLAALAEMIDRVRTLGGLPDEPDRGTTKD